MSTPDQPDRDEDRLLAGEYALGLLPPEEAVAFEDRLSSDPELRALYAMWAEDLAGLLDDTKPVRPPRRVATRLDRALFPEARPPLWRRLGLYGLGGVAAALVVYMATSFGWLQTGLGTRLVPELTASLASEDGALVVNAAYDADTGQLFLERAQGAPAPGRALELWLIAGEAAPVSLGVLPAERTASVALPAALRSGLPGAVLAVSDEPPGGSPTGAPTGDVLALAELTSL